MSTDPGPKCRLTEHQYKNEEDLEASASHTKVIIYTTPTCPDCRTLTAWLEREGIAFEERDLSDPKIMAQAKVHKSAPFAPFGLAGERVFYGSFL